MDEKREKKLKKLFRKARQNVTSWSDVDCEPLTPQAFIKIKGLMEKDRMGVVK